MPPRNHVLATLTKRWLPVFICINLLLLLVYLTLTYQLTFHSDSAIKTNWQGGVAVTRDMSEKLNLGIEVYHQEPDALGDRASTFANLGLIYKLTKHWSLLANGGFGYFPMRVVRPWWESGPYRRDE